MAANAGDSTLIEFGIAAQGGILHDMDDITQILRFYNCYLRVMNTKA